jgi:uncharacterized protein YraI
MRSLPALSSRSYYRFAHLALACALALTACGDSSLPPSAVISSPAANAQVFVGEQVQIIGKVTGSGIKRVDVFINNQRYATVDQAVRPNEFEFIVPWVVPADLIGTAVIQAKGIGEQDRLLIASEAIFIAVQALPATPLPTPEPTPVPTATPVPAESVATRSPASVLLGPAIGNDYVNVRSAPNLNAQLLGQINRGQSVPVRGRTADGTWYQITYPAGPGGVAWVYGPAASITGDAGTLPIVTADGGATNSPPPSGLKPPFVQLKAGQPFANLRSGPDVKYQKVGELNATGVNAAAVRGKSANGQWWQIAFANAPGGVAWVYGQLVDFTGDPNAVPVVAAPPLAAGAPAPTASPTPAAPQPTPTPPIPPSAVLPYSQNVRFSPRNDIGDVPLGHQGQPKTATLEWQINGAIKAELEITTQPGSGIFQNCPAGNLAGITPSDPVGKRMPLLLPSGTFQFTIPDKGYYLFTIYVVKSDGSTTTIPRNVIVDCYKTQ